MKVKLILTEDSFYTEKEQILDDVVEVHYCYDSHEPRTAFEQRTTGFTVANKDIKEFEVKEDISKEAIIAYLQKRINELMPLAWETRKKYIDGTLTKEMEEGTFTSMGKILALADANEYYYRIIVLQEEIDKLNKETDEDWDINDA